MRWPLIAAAALTLAWPLTARASNDPTVASVPQPDARRIVDLHVPAPGVIQRLTLTDGSQLFGQVESIDMDVVAFRTIAGVSLTVAQTGIADLRVASGGVVAGEFWPADSHGTRLLFAPTGRALRKGEGYLGVYELFLPFVQVGITDRLSIGAGTPLVFGGGDGARPFWFTPKLQLVARERLQVATGVIHMAVAGESTGIAYGVTTLGSMDKAATLGLGYAYFGRDRAPIVMIGGEYRAGRRVKWITENWLWGGSDNGFVSGGVRFLGERLSADLGIVVPLIDHTVAFPLVSFAWRF